MSANAAAQALDVTSELDFLNELAGLTEPAPAAEPAAGAEFAAAGTSNALPDNQVALDTVVAGGDNAGARQAAMDTTAELAFLDQLGGAAPITDAGDAPPAIDSAAAEAGEKAASADAALQQALEPKSEGDGIPTPVQGQDHDAQQAASQANGHADMSQVANAVKQEAKEETFEKDATELLDGFKDGAEDDKAEEPVDADALMKQFMLDMKDVDRNSEVDRVLGAFKLNPFEKLNLRFTAGAADVKKAYRQISVLIHPDRCKHPQASDAFEVLNAAHAEVLDEAQREQLMRVLEYARDAVREERRKAKKHDSAIRIAASLHRDGRAGVEAAWEETDDFHEKWKVKARDVLARSEFRRRKLTKRLREEEKRLEAKDEDKAKIRKQAAQDRKDWLQARSNRLNAWQDFTKSGKKGMGTKSAKIEKLDEDKSYVHRTTQEQFVGNYRKKPGK